MESSVAPCLEKKDLEEYCEGKEKQIVWENDLNDIYEIERLVKAESKDEVSKITVNKSK